MKGGFPGGGLASGLGAVFVAAQPAASAAQAVGLRVSWTLVSNDPAVIREFCEPLDYRVIVKAVRGTASCPLFTQMLNEAHLASDACLRLSLAVFQGAAPGFVHLRVHYFGEGVYAAAIESNDFDWREGSCQCHADN